MNKDIKYLLGLTLVTLAIALIIPVSGFISIVTFFSLVKVATYFGVW